MATTRKAPQDRKPKATEAPAPASVTIRARGRDWTIDGGFVDDMEFLETVEELNAGNLVSLPGFCRRLLGAEQYDAAKEVVRDDSGRVRPQALMELIEELLSGDSSEGVSLGESSAS